MTRLFKILLALAIFGAALFVGHQNATAANWPDGRLDQIGSTLAGKPVNVWCEDSWSPWEAFWAKYNTDGTLIQGFTYPGTGSTLFVNPKICESLHALLNNEDVGTYYAADAILVLTHEAMHQKLNSGNEALTECNALKAFPTVIRDLFHVPVTVDESYIASKIAWRKVGKKRVRVRVFFQSVRTVPNMFYAQLVRDAGRWDAVMPAQYHGATC